MDVYFQIEKMSKVKIDCEGKYSVKVIAYLFYINDEHKNE